MKDFEKKLIAQAEELADLTKESIEDFGLEFEESFPAARYFTFVKDGKTFKMRMEVKIAD